MISSRKVIQLTSFIFSIIFVFWLAILISFIPSRAQTVSSPDAIAIRIIPNGEHLSPARWYREQGFTGSPQSLTVDGYDAVRDGRTVYVNAANIDDKGTASQADDELFTNIYLISYNQDAARNTVDIFGNILKHFKLNTNRTVPDNCNLAVETVCLKDSDCPLGDYCLSEKARIIRDVRRLQDISDMDGLLAAYYAANGRYPDLAAGSYLTHQSLSVWPSWQKLLAQYLGGHLPVDPINRLAPCPDNFHPVTCWDEAAKRFDDQTPGDIDITLRAGSRVYKYTGQPNGVSYVICSVMESGYVKDSGSGACPESAAFSLNNDAVNEDPYFANVGLPVGSAGLPYEGSLMAADPNNDEIHWEYSALGSWSGWSAAPEMLATFDPLQKRITAAVAGLPGDYQFTVSLDDGRGGTVSQTFTITVTNLHVPEFAPVGDKTVVIGSGLNFTVNATEADGQYPLEFTFSGGPVGFNNNGAMLNEHDYGVVSDAIIDMTGVYPVNMSVSDSYGGSESDDFNINVVNHPPVISSLANLSITACVTDVSYPVSATDPDGHAVTYAAAGLPAGLAIDGNTGLISGITAASAGSYPVTITVRDQYFTQTTNPSHAQASASFTITVTDETFTVWINNTYDFYATPLGINPLDLYLHPFPYATLAETDAANSVDWVITRTSAQPPIPDLSVLINNAGAINGSAFDNNIPAAGYTFTITVTATTQTCHVSRSAMATLTVYPNQWCGDNIIQAAKESCDGSKMGGGTCQSEGFDNGTVTCNNCSYSTVACCNSGCGSRVCGPDPSGCVADCGSCTTANTACNIDGECICAIGYATCSTNPYDADGCECYTGSGLHDCDLGTQTCCDRVDGGWSVWSGWSDPAGYSDGAGGTCSKTCGGGIQTRTQICNNPSPYCSGLECLGCVGAACPDVNTQVQGCNTQPCCVDDCSTGDISCFADTVHTCGEAGDGDPCLDWVNAYQCGGSGSNNSICNGTGTGCQCEIVSHRNCNGNWADGCEATLGTYSNCSGCGDVCVPPERCAAGRCFDWGGGDP